MTTTGTDIAKIFSEVKSNIARKKVTEKLKITQLKQLREREKKREAAENQKRRLTLARLFNTAKSNFAEMIKDPQIRKFLENKFGKKPAGEPGFAPYFEYMVSNDYFPAYVVVTREYKLKMQDQHWRDWLDDGKEFDDAIRVFTALGNSGRLFIEFLLKDWNKKAKYVNRTFYPAPYCY